MSRQDNGQAIEDLYFLKETPVPGAPGVFKVSVHARAGYDIVRAQGMYFVRHADFGGLAMEVPVAGVRSAFFKT